MENLSYFISFIAATVLLVLVHTPSFVVADNLNQDDIGVGAVEPAVSRSDQEFAAEAAQGGLAEVELGKLGLRRGTSEEVKTFAQQMVGDHQQANERLQKIAAKNQLNLPLALSEENRAVTASLESLSGEEFNREYMKTMLANHQKAVALYERQASAGSNSELRAFASSTLPTLRRHLSHARNVDVKVQRPAVDQHTSNVPSYQSVTIDGNTVSVFNGAELY